VWQNLTFGQINLLLMLAVLVDLVHPGRRWSGVLLGLAAGVKLTPLVFVVLLVLVGRRATAGRALLAFAGTVAIGVAVIPGSAKAYWTENLINAGRVGPPELAHNQSVFGALTRLLDGPPPTLLWLAVAGLLALAVVVVGAVCWRRGDRVLGTGLGALAMLLASPVSWSHHWVWAVPVGLALWEGNRWAGVVWPAVFVVRPFVWPPWGERREYGWSLIEHIPGNAYLLAALAVSIGVAVGFSRRVGPAAGGQDGSGRLPDGRPSAARAGPSAIDHDLALAIRTPAESPIRCGGIPEVAGGRPQRDRTASSTHGEVRRARGLRNLLGGCRPSFGQPRARTVVEGRDWIAG
jgi:alpha-1,2-mannosyltransferase